MRTDVVRTTGSCFILRNADRRGFRNCFDNQCRLVRPPNSKPKISGWPVTIIPLWDNSTIRSAVRPLHTQCNAQNSTIVRHAFKWENHSALHPPLYSRFWAQRGVYWFYDDVFVFVFLETFFERRRSADLNVRSVQRCVIGPRRYVNLTWSVFRNFACLLSQKRRNFSKRFNHHDTSARRKKV